MGCLLLLLVGTFFIYWFFINASKIICWDFRGISSRDTSSWVFCLIKKHNLLLLYLVETRADSARVDQFNKKLPCDWEWVTILDDGYYAGIIVLWCKIIHQVMPIAISHEPYMSLFLFSSSVSWIIFVI